MFDVNQMIASGGLLVIALMVFAESGMMVGFLFPGDTLLLGAGIFAAAGELPLVLSIGVIASAAILGDNTGYCIGRYAGPKIFKEAGHLAHRRIHLQRARRFFRCYGNKAILAAHFFPYIRSVAPLAAGAIKMPAHVFILYDAIGDIAWAISLTLVGYFAGQRIPHIDQYIQPVIVATTAICIVPMLVRMVLRMIRLRRQRRILQPAVARVRAQ